MGSKKGFSLIELMLVLALVLAIGSLSSGFYSRFLLQNEVANVGDQAAQMLRKAQYYSLVSRKSNVSGWGVAFSGGNLILYQGGSYVGRNPALDERFSVNDNITITGLSDINFARLTGIPGGAATINISAGGNSRTIGLNAEGGISR